jgi:hypothetical protein
MLHYFFGALIFLYPDLDLFFIDCWQRTHPFCANNALNLFCEFCQFRNWHCVSEYPYDPMVCVESIKMSTNENCLNLLNLKQISLWLIFFRHVIYFIGSLNQKYLELETTHYRQGYKVKAAGFSDKKHLM